MTTSLKQIEANRQNAKRSTGPATPEGKARSSQNATKHGLLSTRVLAQGDDAEEFREFEAGMVQQLQPDGPLEAVLVDRIVTCAWRLRRVGKLDGEIWSQSTGGILHDMSANNRFNNLGRYEGHVERALFRALHELQRLQAARQGQDVPPSCSRDLAIIGGS